MTKNPYIDLYADRLAQAGGKYPSRDVAIFYNEGSHNRAMDVTVVFIPHDAPDPTQDPDNRRKYIAHISALKCSLNGHSDSPSEIFQYLLHEKGFASKEDERLALKEFTKIAGCEWAQEMLNRPIA